MSDMMRIAAITSAALRWREAKKELEKAVEAAKFSFDVTLTTQYREGLKYNIKVYEERLVEAVDDMERGQ